MAKPSTELDSLLDSTITSLGFDYVGAEFFSQPSGALIRVYVEKMDGHIGIDECADISRQLKSILTVEQIAGGDFTLEVSSPGLERRLFRPGHYVRFVGHNAKILLHHLHNGQRNFVGVIEAADENQLTLNIAGQSLTFLMSDISKGRLIVEFDI